MKANLLVALLLCTLVSSSLYSQTTIGNMKVDQYPITAAGALTYGLTYIPADYDPSKKYPLIIFMHGSGEGGDGIAGLNNLLAQGLPWWIARGFQPSAVNPVDGKTYEFIVVNPQAPSAWHWSYQYAEIQYILPNVLSKYSIDTTRMYITGLSAGGSGTWSCVCDDPVFARRIAAIYPASDAGLNVTAVEGPFLKDITSVYGVPVWCVDGALDGLNAHTTVYLDTINAGPPVANPLAVQTLIPGGGHAANSWDSAYSPTWRANVFSMNAYEWMLQYKRLPATLTAYAGANLAITLPVATATLNGVGTPSAGNSIASYAWTQVSGPSTAIIGSPGSASTAVSTLIAGVYTFKITVKDNTGASATSTMTVTCNPAVNVPPTVSAGSNQTITLPVNSVTLTGTATGNGGATISSTSWTQSAGPNTAAIGTPSALSTTAGGLIAGTYTFKFSATDNNGLSTPSTVTITVKPANVAPTVSAGSNQIITLPVSSVTLTGTATGNGGATISLSTWTETAGPNTAAIGTPLTLSTGVGGLIAGTYTFQLYAIDNNGLSSVSSISVTVNPALIPPTVVAGANQTITLPVNSVTLTGTATGNGGATISSTSWTQTGGPNTAAIGSPLALSTSMGGLIAGTYTFKLSAIDNNGSTGASTLTVTVKPANVPPSVSAGGGQTITLPTNSATLVGTATGNGGATISSTGWTQTGGPNTAAIGTPSALSTSVSGLIAGTYTFQLSATDNNGLSNSGTVTVIVNPAASVPPTVSAGSNQTITLPVNSVTLTGTATGNGGATISSTTWTQTGGPNTAALGTPAVLSTTAGGLIAGTYTFQISATDNNGLSDAASVTVTVKPANVPPTVSAGAAQTITLPVNSVTLVGTATGNGGATISSTTWTETGGPNTAALGTPAALSTTAVGLIAGTYTFQISATDNNGLSSTSGVTITVNAAIPPPPPNVPPTVSAGAAQTITLPVNSVTLVGTATGNGGATISSTTWTETGGPNTAALGTPVALSTTAGGLIAGTYTFQISATDNNGLSSTSGVTITVNAAIPPPPPPPPPNVPPTVSAGSNQTITLPVNSVTLVGTATGNGGATISSTSWTQTGGPNTAALGTPSALSTTAGGLIAGTYTFQISATDNNGLSSASSVTITVNAAVPPPPPPPPPANQPPVANAGPNQTLTLPTSTTTLDGTASYDPDGTIVSYTWMQISGPAGVTITNSNTAGPGIDGLQAATYTFQLTVTDNQGATGTAQVTITVSASVPATDPIANAGQDTTIAIPSNTAVLNGSASTDPGGSIVAYQWQQVSGPAPATIPTPLSAVSAVENLQVGNYVFCLKVVNGQGDTAISMVKVTVVDNLRSTGDHLFLYPNPAQDQVFLRIIGDGTGVAIVNIYDVNGKLVKRTSEVLQAGFSETAINVSNLLKGMYTILVITPDKKRSRIKLMKQ